MSKNGFIGVIDSGIGGISVLNELLKILPTEEFVYFADIKNCPYGEKNTEDIKHLTFSSVDNLIQSGAKAIVIACNTATGSAVSALRETYTDFPIIGIEPAIKPAVVSLPGKNIAVLATPLTIKQEKFQKLYTTMTDKANIIPIPCPNLATLIENGNDNNSIITEYLYDIFNEYIPNKLDGIVLGCTHYTFIKEKILNIFPTVRLFDGNEGTARQTKRIIINNGLLSSKKRGCFKIRTSGNYKETAVFVLKSIQFLNKK